MEIIRRIKVIFNFLILSYTVVLYSGTVKQRGLGGFTEQNGDGANKAAEVEQLGPKVGKLHQPMT